MEQQKYYFKNKSLFYRNWYNNVIIYLITKIDSYSRRMEIFLITAYSLILHPLTPK